MPRLDVVGMIVADMHKAIEFYTRLGLPFSDDPDPEGHGHVRLSCPEGSASPSTVEQSVRSFDPDWSVVDLFAPLA